MRKKMFSLIDTLDLAADDIELCGLHFIFIYLNIHDLKQGFIKTKARTSELG